MTETNNHIIWTQEYQIELDDKKDAFQFQSSISMLQESRINDLLNGIMNKYNDEQSVYQFNKIVLDLGVINKANYENELVFRLEEELTRFFKNIILENGTLRNGKKIVLNDSKLDQFEHFLLRGYLKWNSSFSKTPSALLKELLVENKMGLGGLLAKFGKKEVIRKRMVLQFDETLLEKITATVANHDGIYIIAYKKNMLRHQQKHRLVDTSFGTFRNAVWEVILAYLFVDSNSYYNQKNFLKYLIANIAKKYNLTYGLLLDLISEGIKLAKNSPKESRFGKIITQLAKDQHKIAFGDKQKLNTKRGSTSILIGQINQYLHFGTFSEANQPASRKDLNQQLKILLQTRNQTTLKYITRWLTDPSKRNRFLLLANDEILPQIVKHLNKPFIEESRKFMEALQRSKDHLSTESKALLVEILNAGWRLILQAFEAGKQLSKEEIVMKFIERIWIEYDQQQTFLLNLLNELQSHLSVKHKKVLRRFLAISIEKQGRINVPVTDEKKSKKITSKKTKDQFTSNGRNLENPHSGSEKNIERPDEKILRSAWLWQLIGNDLEKTSLNNTSSSAWNKEVIRLLLKINKQYEISLDAIVDSIIQHISKHKAKQHLQDKLLKLKSSNIYLAVREDDALRKTEAVRINIVNYILDNGRVPWWWEDRYSWEDFNADFESFWASAGHQKQMLQRIQLNGQTHILCAFLDDSNLQRLWKALDKSQGKVRSKLISEIHQLQKKQLLPTESIGIEQYKQFIKEVFNLMLRELSPQIDLLLFDFIKKWMKSSGMVKQRSEKLLFVNLFKNMEKKTSSPLWKNQLHLLINSLSNAKTRKKKDLNTGRTIWDLLAIGEFDLSAGKGPDQEVASLQQIIDVEPKRFNNWLIYEEFRESLLNALKEKHVIRLISLKLSARQRQFLDETINLLHRSRSFISSRDYNKLSNDYLKLVLLKLSAGGFASWRIESWSNLIFHCMTAVIGKSKSCTVLLNINEKLLLKGSDQHKMEIELLDQIQRIAANNATPENMIISKKKEKKDYQKLGEEKHRELLNPVFIKNAGLIILAPYLGMLFEKCGLIRKGKLIAEENIFKAIHLLEYAATGKSDKEEHELVINKLLCGLPISDPVDRKIVLPDKEKEMVDSLLNAVIKQWSVLKGTSVEGLRVSFLQREGKLEEQEEKFYMKVEQKSYDMLLDQIPWNISKVKLSWMKKMLEVEWR